MKLIFMTIFPRTLIDEKSVIVELGESQPMFPQSTENGQYSRLCKISRSRFMCPKAPALNPFRKLEEDRTRSGALRNPPTKQNKKDRFTTCFKT